MRSIEELEKAIADTILLQGESSAAVAKLKSILGLAWLDENSERAIKLLGEASEICAEVGIDNDEIGLDIDYRFANILELRATTETQWNEARSIKKRVQEVRRQYDAVNTVLNSQPYAGEEEEMDSTLVYLDDAIKLQSDGNMTDAIPAVENCLRYRYAKFGAVSPANVNILLTYSDYLRDIGKYSESKDALTLAAQSASIGKVRRNLKTAEVLNASGNLLRITADFPAAQEALTEALSIRKEILGDIHAQVGASLNNLAELQRECGDNLAAVELHLKAIQTFEAAVGSSHPGTINAKGNYAIALDRLARLSDVTGQESLQHAIEYMTANGFEDRHPWLLKFTNESILQDARRNASAQKFELSIERFDTAIQRRVQRVKATALSALDQRALQEIEQERFTVMLRWCADCLDKCKLSQASSLIAACEEFLTLKTITPSADKNMYTARHTLNKARLAYYHGQYSQALQFGEKILRFAKLEDTHPFVITTQQFLTMLHLDAGHVKEAKECNMQALGALQQRLGRDSSTFGKAPITTVLALIASMLLDAKLALHTGNFDVLKQQLEAIFPLIEGNKLQDREVFADYLYLQAKMESVKGAQQQAISSLESALQILSSLYGKEHVKCVECLLFLSEFNVRQTSLNAAFNNAEESVHILKSLFPSSSDNSKSNKSSAVLFYAEMYSRGVVLHAMDRLREAKDMLTASIKGYKATVGEVHIKTIMAKAVLAAVMTDMFEFKEARALYDEILVQFDECFPVATPEDGAEVKQEQPQHPQEQAYTKAMISYMRCLSQVKHSRPTAKVLDTLQDCMMKITTSTSKLRTDGACYFLAEMTALQGRILLDSGEYQLAKTVIGEAGAMMKQYFQTTDSGKIYEILLLSAQLSVVLGKYRDAKIQISFAMARLSLIYGPSLTNHHAVLEPYFLAIENMRVVGYVFDAMDCLDEIENKIGRKFGATSVEMIRVDFAHACILRDRKKFIKAQEKFLQVEDRIRNVYGQTSKLYLEWKINFARCLAMENKVAKSQTMFNEALNTAEQLFGRADTIFASIIRGEMCFLDIAKPQINEQQSSLKVLREDILPLFTTVFSLDNIMTIQLKGRIALLLNSLRKDSGRKALFEVLKQLDELKPFPLPFDHPVVMELGGYEKSSSKDRLSKSIQEEAFFAWSFVDYSSDNVGEFLPKTLFVDVDNHDANFFGAVHYYGTELFTTQSNNVGTVRRGRSMKRGGNRSRSPSPSSLNQTRSSNKNLVSKSSDTLVKEGETLEDALQREHKAKKDAEDAIVNLKHDKANLEEALETEKSEVKRLNEAVEEKIIGSQALEKKIDAMNNDLMAFKQALEAVQAQLQIRLDREAEEERQRAELAALEAAEAKVREERAAWQAAHPLEIAVEDNPLYRKDIAAADFLFKRAQEMFDRGYYFKAQPFYDEGCEIRERIYTMKRKKCLESYRLLAINLTKMGRFIAADKIFAGLIEQEGMLNGVEGEFYLQLVVDSLQSRLTQGYILQVSESLEKTTKILALKTQYDQSNTTSEPPAKSLVALYGQAMILQAVIAMQHGKYNEAKAMIERGQAMLTRAVGINHMLVAESMIYKAQLLLELVKGREAVSLVDQVSIIVKVIMKAADDAMSSSSDAPIAAASAGALPAGSPIGKATNVTAYEHPLLAQCKLIYARAYLLMCKYNEAKKNFVSAKELYAKFYTTIDHRMFAAEVYEARMEYDMSHFFNAEEKLLTIITQLQEGAKELFDESASTNMTLGYAYDVLGQVQYRLGIYDAALTTFDKVIQIASKQPNNLLHYDAKIVEISILLTTGKHTLAKDVLEEVLDKLRGIVPKEHPMTIHLQILYGECHYYASDSEECEKYYTRALKAIKTIFPEGHWLICEIFKRQVEVNLSVENRNLIAAKVCLNEMNSAVNAIYGAVVEHEYYAVMMGLESRLMLYTLIENTSNDGEGSEEGDEEEGQEEEEEEVKQDDSPAQQAVTTEEEGGEKPQANETEATENTHSTATPNPETASSHADPQDNDNDSAAGSLVIDGDRQEDDVILPDFDNDRFRLIQEKIGTTLDRYLITFKDRVGAPFISYLQGLLGEVKLLEYIELQKYIRSLSSLQREVYFNNQAAEQRAASKGKGKKQQEVVIKDVEKRMPDPEGKEMITQAIKQLVETWHLDSNHPSIIELQVSLQELRLQFDDLEIARYQFLRAKQFKSLGRFLDADKLLDESFALFFSCLGPIQSSQSIIMAEILFEKAENTRHLVKKVDFITSMHLLSIRIYRLYHGEITDEFILKNLLSMTALLVDQKLYDDALTTYQSLELTFITALGTLRAEIPDDQSKIVLLAQIKTSIAECLLSTHRYEEAQGYNTAALELLKSLSGAKEISNAILANSLILVYLNDMQIYDAFGQFENAVQFYTQIETIFSSWEKSENEAKLEGKSEGNVAMLKILKAKSLHIYSQHLFLIQRLHDASLASSQSLDLRLSLFNRYIEPKVAQKKVNKRELEVEWTVEKEEEVKLNFMNALDTLMNTGLQRSSTTAKVDNSAPKSSTKLGLKATAEETEKLEESNLEQEMEMSMKEATSDFQPSDGDNKQSAEEEKEVEQFSVLEFLENAENLFIMHDGKKVTAHVLLVESFLHQAKINLLLGRVNEVKELLTLAQDMLVLMYTKPSLLKLEVMFYFAELLILQNKLEESRLQHTKILEMRLSFVTSRSLFALEISDSYLALSKIYVLQCKYDDALQYVNDAMKIERKCFSFLPHAKKKEKDSHYRLQSMCILGAEILYSRGFYSDSVSLLSQAIPLLKSTFFNSDLHLTIAQALILKGRNAFELSKFDDSLTLFQQAKSIFMVISSDEHFYQLGLVHYYMSQTLRAMGKLLEAKEALDIAVKAKRMQLGKYHFYTVFTLIEIGLNFCDLGKLTTAEHVLKRAMSLLKKAFNGKDHLSIGQCSYAIGELMIKMGLITLAHEFFETSLYVIRKVIGHEKYPLVALITASRCEVQAMKGQCDLATHGVDDAIALLKVIYDTSNHYHISRLTLLLAKITLQRGQFHEAKIFFDRSTIILQQVYSHDHPILHEAQFGIAQCMLVMGQVESSKALLERCLVGVKDWKGSHHPLVATVLNKLADVLNILYRFDAAEALLLEAYALRYKVYFEVNESHPDLAENLLSLAVTLRLKGVIGSLPANKDGKAGGLNDKKKKLPVARPGSGSVASSSKASSKKSKESAGSKEKAKVLTANNEEEGDDGNNESDEDDNDDDQQQQEHDEEISVPSIAISAIEKLDQEQSVNPNNNNAEDSLAHFAPISGADALKGDSKNYKAIPMLNKALIMLLGYYDHDEYHPQVLAVKTQQAECLVYLGKYEQALVDQEIVFHARRKSLGDQHIDTVASLVSILDILRIMKKVFPVTNAKVPPPAHAAPNNSQEILNAKFNGTVSLVDHLTSLTLPITMPKIKSDDQTAHSNSFDVENNIMIDPTLKEIEKAKRQVLQGMRRSSSGMTIPVPWVFLSKVEELPGMTRAASTTDVNGKKKASKLSVPRGYMGYAFPSLKSNTAYMNTADNASTGGERGGMAGALSAADRSNGNAANPLHDAKKVVEWALAAFRKLFAAEYETLGLTKKNDVMDHPLTATCLYHKGEIFRLRGDGMQAMRFIEQSLAMRRRIFRTHHPAIADCLYSIGELLRSDNRFSQARPVYDKALEIRQETFGSNHPVMAEIHNALALVAIAQGQFISAKIHLEQSLAICEEKLGTNHPASALVCNNHAILLQSTGELKEALIWYRKSLVIKQKVFGETHPETAATLNNLGLLLKAQNKPEEAIRIFQKTLEIQRKVLGQKHPDTASTENNLAAILSYSTDGQKFTAKELFKSSLATRTEIFGSENVLVASTMNNFAVLLFTMGEIGQAKELFEDALKVRRKLLGDSHPSVAESLHNVGYWFYTQGYLTEARYNYEEALRIRVKLFGNDHLQVATTALHLSGVCDQAGDLNHALEYVQLAHQARVTVLGEEHPETKLCERSVQYIERRVQSKQQQQAAAARKMGGSSSSSSNGGKQQIVLGVGLGFEVTEHNSVSIGEQGSFVVE